MGLFSWGLYETTFQGEQVKMELRPLKSKEMMTLLPLARALEEEGKKRAKPAVAGQKEEPVSDLEKLEQAEFALKLQADALLVLRDAVRNIQGLDVLVGEKVTPEMLCEEFVFSSLALNVLTRLFVISTLTETEVKNSNAPSGK